tara:strand:+ start:686 stop:889 length:204 start_codon:yes stop_codon:yes gene_type:complete
MKSFKLNTDGMTQSQMAYVEHLEASVEHLESALEDAKILMRENKKAIVSKNKKIERLEKYASQFVED